MTLAERRRRLREAAGLPADGDAFSAIDPGALGLELADGMIENVIGTYALPFAVAMNFCVDGTEVFVPMAVEEPSVVAAASNAARMARPVGFVTVVSPPVMIGQIQIVHVADVDAGAAALRAEAEVVLDEARRMVPRLTERVAAARARHPHARAVRPDAACWSRTSTSTVATRWARTWSTRCARRSPSGSRSSPVAAPVSASCPT
ncbi:MAG: hypothetical protein WKG01_10555 [Kofleriaceae bacterium]